MKHECTIKALVFDVFGTVVDWRGSLIREGRALGQAHGLDVDWAAFADAWRNGYQPAMQRVRSGELPWTRIDDLHRMILEDILKSFGIRGLSKAQKHDFNFAWHRLRPWPDSVRGLRRLKQRFTIATLSNGNVSLLSDMARNAGLPWDVILSAEIFHHYKPDLEVYRGAAAILDAKPRETLMVAAHKDDLRAAKRAGLRTAFVRRPLEYGRGNAGDLTDEPGFDFNCDSFLDLADQLDRA